MAIVAQIQIAPFDIVGGGNAGSITTGRDFKLNKVKTTTFEEYVKQNSVTSIDLIKMDTEGTENLILVRSSFVLRSMKPIIIWETLLNVIEKELEEIIFIYGYEFYCPTENRLKKQVIIVRIFDDGRSNCFFVHPEKRHLIS